MESKFESEVQVLEIGIQGRSEKMSQNLSNLPASCCRWDIWLVSRDDRNISNILPRYFGTNSLQKCNNNSDSLFTEVNLEIIFLYDDFLFHSGVLQQNNRDNIF